MEFILKNTNEKVKPILTYPDANLRKKSEEVSKDDNTILELISTMRETMNFKGGIGLAAPQIGVLKRVIIVNLTPEDKNSEIVMINPTITSKKDLTKSQEGCLSVPGYHNSIIRSRRIEVEYTNYITGETKEITASKYLSCAIQHEIDHLNGTLFIDRLKEKPRQLFVQVYGKE